MVGKKALFLDRDGVINRRLPGYVTHPDELDVFPFVREAIHFFKEKFDLVFIVTNQQGIGKKLMTEADLHTVHEKMLSVIDPQRTLIDAVFFCPHLESENCTCRKPAQGMAMQAKKLFPDINFDESLMVGDSVSDIDFGKNLGMQTVALAGLDYQRADFFAGDLREAALLWNTKT
jgi:histidinol-phosphate phosphatase family protein